MQRARRLAASVVLVVGAVGALSACARSEPDVAAYVGSTRIAEERVDAVYEDARVELEEAVAQLRAQQRAQNPDATPDATPVELSIDRQEVLTTLVGVEVLRTVAQQRGVQPSDVPAEQVAQSLQLPPDAEFVELYTEYRGYLDAFAQRVQPVQVTDDELRDVYERLRDGGGLGPQAVSFEEFKAGISPEDQQLLQQNIGLRNELTAAAEDIDVRVNPRYGEAEMDLVTFRSGEGEALPLVVMAFQEQTGTPAVVDLP